MNNNYLCHFGILGMKWGVRRYQNKDGSLTAEGKKHVKAYNEYDKKGDAWRAEGDRIVKSSKKLTADFGKFANIDDLDFFDLMCQEYKIDTKNFDKLYSDQATFYRNNRESIETGRMITNKILKKR